MTSVSSGVQLVLWGGGTSRTMRPHWALHELGLAYEKRLVAPRSGETATPEFTRLNPKQKVPVLEDGDLVLTESAAIVTHLGDTRGAESELTPAVGTPERSRYDEWCFFVMTELDAHTLYVIRKHRDLAALYGESPVAVRAAREGFDKQVGVADAALADGRPHLLGETFTGADILLVTCLDWAVFCGIPLSDGLASYCDRHRSRRAYETAFAVNFSVTPNGSPRSGASLARP